jgi:hypothetical protein
MRRMLVASLSLLVMISAPAVAQTCLGLASYADGRLQVTGTGSLSTESSSFGTGLAYGRPSSMFGGLTLGTTSNEALNGSTLEFGGSLGYQIALGNNGQTQLCPVAGFSVGIGPKNTVNSGVDRSNKTASVGLALATSFLASPRLKIVPTLGLAYAHRQDKAENNSGANLFEIAQNYAQVQIGVGLVLNSTISIRPSADIPLGLDSNDPTFRITLGYSFGNPHRVVGVPPRFGDQT